MKFTERTCEIQSLVGDFQHGILIVDPEYQRGAVWTDKQQCRFIDSVFRGYPVPAVFIREKQNKGSLGSSVTFDIVDGQQRLRALRDFIDDKLRLMPTSGEGRLRLPPGVASMPAPWAGRTWSELDESMRERFKLAQLRVFIVEHSAGDDEVRDLFIRLQAGTALNRQQVRDAWPGPIAPFIQALGGKGRHQPQSGLMGMVDRRGARDSEDDSDPWVSHRQTCAQLLSVFLDRENDPYARPRLLPDELDEMYHERTTFDRGGPVALRFRAALTAGELVFTAAAQKYSGQKNKWKKVHVFAVFMVCQDVLRSPDVPQLTKNTDVIVQSLWDATSQDSELQRHLRFSGGAVARWAERLQEAVFSRIGRLDPNRLFSADQRAAIRERCQSLCGVCKAPVADEDGEYDHFPIPWARCGPTTIDNGRLVHGKCHPRGPLAPG